MGISAEWPAHLPIVGGGGVERWYQSISGIT